MDRSDKILSAENDLKSKKQQEIKNTKKIKKLKVMDPIIRHPLKKRQNRPFKLEVCSLLNVETLKKDEEVKEKRIPKKKKEKNVEKIHFRLPAKMKENKKMNTRGRDEKKFVKITKSSVDLDDEITSKLKVVITSKIKSEKRL